MTNEELNMTIEYLKEMQESYIEGKGYERHPIPEWYALDKAIEALEQPRWIPVSERLPEEWESVLVCFKTQGGMAQAVSERFDGDRWSALCEMKPIAWMPLPLPYKSESEE